MAAAPKPSPAPRPAAAPRPAPTSTGVAVSTRGAVDLSTYGAATAPSGGAPAGGPTRSGRGSAVAGADGTYPPGAFSVEVTEETFQTEVLDRSVEVPVVLDLWATWCEPCKQLSPILEKIADEYAGRFVLATIDVDAEQRIAQALQVQSIPTVLAVIAGQLVPLFTGAVPEDQVRSVLDEVLRVAVANGVTGTAPARVVDGPAAAEAEPEPPDPRFTAAEDAIDAGDLDGAVAAYRRILAAEPDNADAAAALVQTLLLQRVQAVDPAAARAAAAAEPADLEAGLVVADLDLLGGHVDDAFARLIGLVRSHSGAERDRVRTRLVELFSIVGPDDPRVSGARIALANALY